MKNIAIFLFAIVLFSCKKEVNAINANDTSISKNDTLLSQKSYYTMLKDINIQYELILDETRPINFSIVEYKTALVSGKIGLSSRQQNKMLNATKPLIDYATRLAKIHSIEIDDLGSLIALGGMYSPNDSLNIKYHENSFNVFDVTSKISLGNNSKQTLKFEIDRQEAIDCAIEALGLSLFWSFSGSNLSMWSVKAVTKAFSAAASKFLGPLGVSIAVVSFGYCIYQEGND